MAKTTQTLDPKQFQDLINCGQAKIAVVLKEDELFLPSFRRADIVGNADIDNKVMTKQERIFQIKEDIVLRVHIVNTNQPRTINPPKPGANGQAGLWNTLMPGKIRVSAKTYEGLIEKLYDLYGDKYTVQKLRFEDVFNLAIADYEERYPTSDRTISSHKSTYKRCCLGTHFSQLNVEEIKEKDLLTFCFQVIGLKDSAGNTVIGNHEDRMNISYFKKSFMALLNLIFNYAIRNHMITENPMNFLDKKYLYSQCNQPHTDDAKKRHTDSEYEMILSEAKRRANMTQFHGYYIYLYLIETHQYLGCRPGELVALKWEDLQNGVLHICHAQKEHKDPKTWYECVDYTKNEKGESKNGRYIPLIPELEILFNELRQLQDSLGIHSEFIFCNSSGEWIVARSYEARLKEICKKLGIESYGTYTYRRDVNNRLAETGVQTFERAKFLGHSPEVNQKCYASPRNTGRDVLIAALSRETKKQVSPGITFEDEKEEIKKA